MWADTMDTPRDWAALPCKDCARVVVSELPIAENCPHSYMENTMVGNIAEDSMEHIGADIAHMTACGQNRC